MVTPAEGEDLLDKYGLPDDLDPDQTTWPPALKSLGVTKLRIDEDLDMYPWGKPALALQRTLAKATGYTKDAMFTETAMKALYRIEQRYFTQSITNRRTLSSKGADHWTLTTKGRKCVTDALTEVDGTKDSHHLEYLAGHHYRHHHHHRFFLFFFKEEAQYGCKQCWGIF